MSFSPEIDISSHLVVMGVVMMVVMGVVIIVVMGVVMMVVMGVIMMVVMGVIKIIIFEQPDEEIPHAFNPCGSN